MADRLVRVVLSAAAEPFVASMRTAADSVKLLARAGVDAKASFADITVSVGELRVKVDELGRVQGLQNVARDLGKVKAAISGVTGVSELAHLTTSLRDLGAVGGGGLSAAAEDIKRLATAVRSMSSSVGSSTELRDFISALHGLSSFSGATAADELTKMSSGIRRLIKDANSVPAIRALAAALRDLGTAGGGLGGLGNLGNSLHGMQSQIDQLQRSIAQLRASGSGSGSSGSGGSGSSGGGGLLSGGAGQFLKYTLGTAAVTGFGAAITSTIKQTADFETEILTLGAVTKTSGTAVLQQASAKALQLGADFTIAGASASDAAVTMTELAKGGLSVADSMTAAKGSLQLASAGQVSFASAAEIMTSALAAFQLPAAAAGQVTDVLANTANAARGNISDFAAGLTYAGTTAHQAGYNIQQTSTVLALFAQNGQTGSVGGTTFAEMLLKLEAPSGKAKSAIKELGLTLYDSNGAFISARSLADELSKAKGRMSLADYNAAATTVFGARAIRGATILAQEGTVGYDKMSKSINDGAGAAAFSAARMQGLGGAFANLQNQVQTAQVTLGEKFSPALQGVLNKVSDAIPVLTGFLTGASFGGGLSKIGTFFEPLVQGAGRLVSVAWPYIENFAHSVGQGFQSIVSFIKPVVDAIGNFWKTAADNGSVGRVANVLAEVGTAFKDVMAFIAPVGSAIGGAIKWIGSLGTFGTVIGTVVTAMLGFKLVQPILTSVLGAMGKFTGATAGVQSFTATFRALSSTGMSGIASSFGAIGQSAVNMGKGLLAAFGGPVGIAIAGVTTAIALFSGNESDSSKKAASLSADNQALASTFDQVTAAATDSTKALLSDQLQQAGTLKAASDLGLNTSLLIPAILGSKDAMASLNSEVDAGLTKWVQQSQNYQSVSKDATAAGISVADLADGIRTGNNSLALDKWNAYIATVGASSTTAHRMNNEQSQLSALFRDGIGAVAPYNAVLGDLSSRSAGAAADQEAVREKVAALASTAAKTAGVVIQFNQDFKNSSDAAAASAMVMSAQVQIAANAAATGAGVSAATLALIAHGVTGAAATISETVDGDLAHAQAIYDNFAAHVAGIQVTVSSKGVDSFSTAMSSAFTAYTAAVTAADTETNLFVFTMDKLAGRNISVEDAMAANGAAVRGIGAAYRAQIQNSLDLQKATDDLAAARKNLGATNNDGTAASNATTQADITAAELKLADAQDKVAGSSEAIRQAYIAEQKTAALRIVQVATAADQQGGYTAAIKAGSAEIANQRQLFIAAAEAAGVGSVEANKLADSYGLIPKNVTTILNADPTLAIAGAAEVQKNAADATAAKTVKFNAATKDAQLDIATFGNDVSKIPTIYQTSFKADVATASQNGQNLYNVYNKTTGQWTAQFETPNAAAAQTAAGNLVVQYDKAQGTWNARLTATDLASDKVTGVQRAIDALTGKTVEVNVVTKGSSYIQPSTGNQIVAGFGHSADGGYISGPGGPREDKIPTMLSNGEFVVNAASTAKNLPLLHALNAQKYADGGLIGTSRVNLKGSGDISGASAPMSAFYSVIDGAVSAANAAAAAAQAAAVAPTSSSAGVEQWRALASQVFAAKGVPLQYVQTLLNQMNQESSGNPAAINLTDSNAQAGHPSEGLLQFIQGTFNAYADPGFNSNIWDPASQMHAFVNYINADYGGMAAFTARQSANGWGPYANGGYVSGPGGPRSDSIPARLSNGEFVVNAASTAKNLGLLHTINSYANGGLVLPSAQNLAGYAGIAPPGSGPVLSQVITALTAIATQVAKQDAALVTARVATQKAIASADAAAVAATLAEKKAQSQYTAAQLSAATASNAKIDAAQARLDRAQASASASQLAAQQRLQAAHDSRSKNHDAIVEAAQNHLAAVQVSNSAKVTAAETALHNVRTAQHSASQVAQAAVAAAHAKVAAAADKARVAQAAYESTLDRTEAINKVQAAYQRQYQTQQKLAAQLDALNTKQQTAQANLTSLVSQRTSDAASITSSGVSYGGGLTGNSAQRGTFDSILNGQQYDLNQIASINKMAQALKAKGLTGSSIQSAVNAALGGDSTTLTALSGASAAQIKQLNSVTGQIQSWSANLGSNVAGAMDDAGIQAAQGLISGLNSQQAAIQAAMAKIANSVVASFKATLKIHSPSKVFHELGQYTAQGYVNGVASSSGAVNAAVGRMVGMPQIPQSAYHAGGFDRVVSQLASQVQVLLTNSSATNRAISETSRNLDQKIVDAMSNWQFRQDPQGVYRMAKAGAQMAALR